MEERDAGVVHQVETAQWGMNRVPSTRCRFNARSSSMAVFVVMVVIAVMIVIMTDVDRVGMAIAPARRR